MDTTFYRSGKSSIVLNGVNPGNRYYGQDMNIPGEAGAAIAFSGWSYATGVSGTGGDYMVLLRIDYADGGTGWFGQSFTKADHSTWEYQERTVTIPKDFKSFAIFVKYENKRVKPGLMISKFEQSVCPMR